MNNKFTLASLKKFIRENKDNLWIKHISSFDAMQDCVVENKTEFRRTIEPASSFPNNLGIGGAWLVLQGSDYFTSYEDAEFRGIEVYNCCGLFVLAVRKYYKLEGALSDALNKLTR